MKKRFVILLFAVSVFSTHFNAYLNAQGTKYNNSDILHPVFAEKAIISLVPLPVIFNGFRIDADIRLHDHLWLNIAPRVNLKTAIDSGAKFVLGGGLDINARYYIKNKPLGFYVSAGIGAEYNRLGNIVKKTKQYYELTAVRFGGQTHLGYSVRLWPRCVMDFYAGATFRWSKNSFPTEEYKATVEYHKPNPFSYYFTGLCFDGGIRISIIL